jgi:hypothetical protein
MWRVVYRELRALTNDSTMRLNPMEINDLYEAVWNVGVDLQSDDALTILDLEYRPWPKMNEGTEASTEFYRVHDRNKQVPRSLSPNTFVQALPYPTNLPPGTSGYAAGVRV